MNAAVERFTRGDPLGVDVEAIERELASLWREAGADGASAGTAVTRACLANLLVWHADDKRDDHLQEALDGLVTRVPARVLVLRARPLLPGEREFESFITAHCVLAPGGGKLVCAEEVTLVARGPGTAHLASVVRALLVPDVPTTLAVSGTPPCPPGPLEPLLALVDRLVVDTGQLADPADFPALDALVSLAPATVDEGWMQLASVRASVASVFDHAGPREQLPRLERVELQVPRERETAALLLLGWLADRLGWDTAQARRAGGPARAWQVPWADRWVQVAVREAGPGGASVLELQLPGGSVKAGFGGDAEVCMESLGRPVRHMARDFLGRGECLARALGPHAVDPLLLRAWGHLRALLRTGGVA